MCRGGGGIPILLGLAAGACIGFGSDTKQNKTKQKTIDQKSLYKHVQTKYNAGGRGVLHAKTSKIGGVQ